MTNDEYIQRVAAERGVTVDRVIAEAISLYRSEHEDDGSNMYSDALYLQIAANPRAVVGRFKRMMNKIVAELEAEYGCAGTEDILHHPVFVALCSKLHAFAGYGYRDSTAFILCEAKASPEALKLLGIEPRTGAA